MECIKMHTHFHYTYIPAPPDSDGQTLFLFHGTGGNEKDMIPLGRQLAPRSAMLSPRGKVVDNENTRFFRKWPDGKFDENDVRFRAYELVEFLESALQNYSLNKEKVIGAGYSNGANIATAIMLLHPKVLCRCVLFRPIVPLIPESLPDLSGVPVFIAAGNNDQLVSKGETEKLVEILSGYGADVCLHWNEGTHALNEDDVNSAKDWLSKH